MHRAFVVAELPWYPMFASDWLSSRAIAQMLPEQEGAYIHLLNLAWGDGSAEPCLPIDDSELAHMSRLTTRWKKLGALVRAQFEERDGNLYNAKLSAVWKNQQEKHAGIVAKAKAGGTASAAKRKAKGATKGGASSPTTGSTTGTTQGSANTDSLASEPYGSEEQETTASAAPAPEGAAPPAAPAGDNHITASAREALNRRGIRDEQIDAAPRGNLADHTAELEWRQSQYEAELKAEGDRWMREHPDETAEIGEEIRRDLGYPTGKSASALSATRVEILRASVVEEIRRRNDWPRLDAWDGCEFKTPVSA